VSLKDNQGRTVKSYYIGDATGKAMFEFKNSFDGDPYEILGVVHKVRVQLEGSNHLHMREVKVFDTSGVDRALSKTATQSSTSQGYPASKAVNGDLGDFSHTDNEAGMYHELTNSNLTVKAPLKSV
jgi:hypothetical protein